MPNNRVTFTVPRELTGWKRGFEKLPVEIAVAGTEMWKAATDVLFDRSQQYVHVITGDLKSSGTSRTYIAEGSQLVGEVSYGNDQVDYAQYEEDRGGEHAYLQRAWLDSQTTFDTMLPGLWGRLTATWS